MRAPLAPPRMSVLRNVLAEAQAARISSRWPSPLARICALSVATSPASIIA
jgi:hypothetical protein